MHYRIFTLDRSKRVSRAPWEVDCVDDISAMRQAVQLADGHDFEVWEGTRFVVHLDAAKYRRVERRTFHQELI